MSFDTRTEEVKAARTELEAAIRKCIDLEADERHPYVVGWALNVEYVSTTLVDRNLVGHMPLVPDDQPYATSRGLFEMGADAFARYHSHRS